MLQRAIRVVKKDSGQKDPMDEDKSLQTDLVGQQVGFDVVAENFSAFYATLSSFFKRTNYNDTHVLVLDRIDQLPDNPADLYSCFSRLSEISDIDNLLVIFVINTLEPKFLLLTSIPHIHFPRYSTDDAVNVVSKKQLRFLPEDRFTEQEQKKFWNQYCSMVVNALSSYTGSDIRLIKEVALKLWPEFIRPVLEEDMDINNFVQLYRRNQKLFVSEVAVTDSLIDFTETINDKQPSAQSGLPKQSKYILCAAYLASYNNPRYDIRFFSRAKEARSKRRDTNPRKKLKVSARSLAAPPFELERLLAILHSIIPDDFIPNIDIGVQIATLTTLKLIVRTSNTDPLDSRTRWKVNASWTLVKQVADDIGFEIEDYLVEWTFYFSLSPLVSFFGH